MIQIDLVTGFLGSGKTTFIKKYVSYLTGLGLRVGIIENDFGAVNVDVLILQELEGEKCGIEPIVGGNVASDWRRRFKAKLITLSMQGFDRVVVEPSGIYETEDFFDVLYDEPVNAWYEIGNVFALVDGRLKKHLSKQAEYLLMSQVANCGLVVLSKLPEVSRQDCHRTIQRLQQLLTDYDCHRTLEHAVFARDWESLTREDYERLLGCGWVRGEHKRLWFDKNEIFSTLFFLNVQLPENEVMAAVEQLLSDDACGEIFRVKGFFPRKDGGYLEINATREHREQKVVPKGQNVVIVIGEKLVQEKIASYFPTADEKDGTPE